MPPPGQPLGAFASLWFSLLSPLRRCCADRRRERARHSSLRLPCPARCLAHSRCLRPGPRWSWELAGDWGLGTVGSHGQTQGVGERLVVGADGREGRDLACPKPCPCPWPSFLWLSRVLASSFPCLQSGGFEAGRACWAAGIVWAGVHWGAWTPASAGPGLGPAAL